MSDIGDRAIAKEQRLRRIMEASQRTGVSVRTLLEQEALEQQQSTSKREKESESKRTTKSFSGLLKSLRAKYGIKAVTSDDGEELEDDKQSWEEFDKGKDGQEDQSKISEMVSEKSYSSQVPIPHGNLSKTNIPPVEWEPGVGAKNYVDPYDVEGEEPKERSLSDAAREEIQRVDDESVEYDRGWLLEEGVVPDRANVDNRGIIYGIRKLAGQLGAEDRYYGDMPIKYNSLSELASFFKDMSDEKAFGQVHREKALELLQKAAPYHLLHRGQQAEDPRINRVYSTMSRGELAFNPNPAGPPAPKQTPTQEEIWQQVKEDAAREGKEPAFHPTEDENIPYAEPHIGDLAFIFPEQKAFKVGDRVQEVGSNPKNPQVNGPHGEITWVPKGNDQNSTVDYQMDDGDFTVSARADQLYKTPAKALSVLNSFLKAFYNINDPVQYTGGDPNQANPSPSMMELAQHPVRGVVSGVRDYQGSNESFGDQELSGITTDPPGQRFTNVPSHLYAKIPPQ